MKRKRSDSPSTAEAPAKKLGVSNSPPEKRSGCLIQLLTQYGVLRSVITNLLPKDVCSLAATSRSAYAAILPHRQESMAGLLRLMKCDGSGVRLRKSYHQKSEYFDDFDCQEHVRCGADGTLAIDSRPCTSCGINTCDECRIHCVYQSIYQPPDECDELPNYSGFALLDRMQMGILSPEHFGITDTSPWRRPTNKQPYTPHHDEGFLDIPLESKVYAAPESVESLLDTDLGAGPLRGRASSDSPYPSPVIRAFWNVTELRKQPLCVPCFDQREPPSNSRCKCTLRSRFLDRWLCLHCFRREQRNSVREGQAHHCKCGQTTDSTMKTICLWCNGEVANNM